MQYIKQYKMDELLEFKIIVILQDDSAQKFIDMGITPTEDSITEKFVKYSFDATKISEIRQTFIKYKEQWLDAVVVTYGEDNYETPPLIIHYDEFKKQLNEHNKKNT